MSKIPYERVVAWAAGPSSAINGWLATQVTNHLDIFGSLGVGKGSKVANAIFNAVVFASAAAATWAGHSKWLDNLKAYWVAHPQLEAVTEKVAAQVEVDTTQHTDVNTLLHQIVDDAEEFAAAPPEPEVDTPPADAEPPEGVNIIAPEDVKPRVSSDGDTVVVPQPVPATPAASS